ncbi:MAG: hypothetical protein GY862_33675, partial [Gammaproteobacteria bacterium]|nr:hypothetical protein [Gammaproteobacteria bacterium]
KEKYLGENHPENVHCGWLGKEQCDWFKECLDDYKKQGWLRIAALHHNVKRRAAYDEENLKDADQFEEILGDSLNLVLHGHTHEGKQEWLGHSAPVPVLATGSIALKDQALADAPNQYQIIRIAENQFSRWCRQFAKDKNGWIGDNRASPKGDNWHHNISVTLDSASNTFAESDIANHFDLPSKERPDDDTFIARVEEVCRLHNPDAEITRYSHQHLPYLRVGAKEGGFVHTYPLGVAKHGITQEMLDKFSRQVADKYRSGDSRLISYLVYEGERASEKLIRYARRLRICLQSFIEYQGLIDFRHYLERQTEKLRNDPVYPPESLLHLSINSQPPHATDFVD